jgi:hypothetical protein
MRRISRLFLASVLAAGAFLLTTPAVAAASPHVACGATLTTNTTLTHDLHCPSGPGLILVGNITLNLGGHGLYGATDTYPGYDAIQTEVGDTVHVTNGRIQEWFQGITQNENEEGASTTDVSHVTFVHENTSFAANNTTYSVTNSTFEYDTFGVFGMEGFGTVTHSNFYQVGTAIDDWEGGNVDVSYDTFSGPSGASDQAGGGVFYSEAGGTISHCAFTNVKRAVSTFFTGANLIDSTISGATTAYELDFEAGGLLTGDTFTHNATNVDVELFAAVRAYNNLFEYSGPNEFYVAPPDPGDMLSSSNVLVGNKFYKNRGNGVDINLPGSSFKLNKAIDNTGHGLVAPGSIDLGGNVAYGNLKKPQCIGVVCH